MSGAIPPAGGGHSHRLAGGAILTALLFVGLVAGFGDNLSSIWVNLFRPEKTPQLPEKPPPRVSKIEQVRFEGTSWRKDGYSFDALPNAVALVSGINFGTDAQRLQELRVNFARDIPGAVEKYSVPINPPIARTTRMAGTESWECVLDSAMIMQAAGFATHPFGRYKLDWLLLSPDGTRSSEYCQRFAYVIRPTTRLTSSDSDPTAWFQHRRMRGRVSAVDGHLEIVNPSDDDVAWTALRSPFDFPNGFTLRCSLSTIRTGQRHVGVEFGFHSKQEMIGPFSMVLCDGGPSRVSFKQGGEQTIAQLATPHASELDGGKVMHMQLCVRPVDKQTRVSLCLGGSEAFSSVCAEWTVQGWLRAPAINRIDLRAYNAGTIHIFDFWVEEFCPNHLLASPDADRGVGSEPDKDRVGLEAGGTG